MTTSENRKRKGYTLAEILIVVAIIAVLVAIAIPIFTTILESSREAYDIATMRQAANAAIELYYSGVTDESSATAAGLKWWPNNGNDANAAGVYDPVKGTFLPIRSNDNQAKKMAYGKGTKINGGTSFTLGNDRGAYAPNEDYTKAVVMIAIYPIGNNKRVEIYWKGTDDGKYIGGQVQANDPRYSIRISLQ